MAGPSAASAAEAIERRRSVRASSTHARRRSARRNCRRSSRAGSTRSTRPAAGRCSSSSPAACASASRRGSPRPPRQRSAARTPDEIELIWPGLRRPISTCSPGSKGRADKPRQPDPAPFRPPMLAHAIEESRSSRRLIRPISWRNGNGTASACRPSPATTRRRAGFAALFAHRRGHFQELSRSARGAAASGAIDGELLIMRDGRVQSFNVLQQRLNRKAVTPKLLAEFPAHLRAYDLLAEGEEDLRELPFAERRKRLKHFIARLDEPRIDLSPLDPVHDLGRACARARRSGRGRCGRGCGSGRRRHAQAARRALPAGPAERACGGNGSATR